MSILVQKFGGTSVGSVERILNVANKVRKELDKGYQVVVVVSAMSGETNRLVALVDESKASGESQSLEGNSSSGFNAAIEAQLAKEHDVVVSSGEQVTCGLLALTLQKMGIKARSMLSWQVPIITDNAYSKARIESIDDAAIKKELNSGNVVVIPGFQGVYVDEQGDKHLTTLGRGGSDTSAVAVAAALNAERCDIYTDVDGIYTTDPRIVSKARKLNKVSFEEVLEMASLGAKVLHGRSVELAMKNNLKVQVRSSFNDNEGTFLVEEEEVVERRLVTGLTYSKNDVQITLKGLKNKPGIASDIFAPLSRANINVDMIVQNVDADSEFADVTFTVPKTDLDAARECIKGSKLEYAAMNVNSNVAKLSVVGVGMRSHAGLAHKMFETLAAKGVNILVISTSEIKISVLIDDEYIELALRALHTAYGLDG